MNRIKKGSPEVKLEALKLRIKPNELKSKKSELPFINRGIGNVTYEHCLTEELYGGVYFGTAERNYYVDGYHEICLCVHYNRRTPGKYEFDKKYHYFVTNERKCLDIYWNLGNISDESSVVEYYADLDEAKGSLYYKDFCELQGEIQAGIKWRKEREYDPFEFGGMCYGTRTICGREIRFFQIPQQETRKFIQFFIDEESEQLLRITETPIDISNHMGFMNDFFEIDQTELHLVREIQLVNGLPPQDTIYEKLYSEVLEEIEDEKNTFYC